MKNDTALLLVDIQNDYFSRGAMELCGMDVAAENAAKLLDFFRDNRMPVFHVRHVSTRPGAAFFLPDTPGAEIHKSVVPREVEPVVVKPHPNSFRETALMERLKNGGVRRLVICGAMSHMCVDATTRAAADFGYECVVAHDACATRDLSWNGTLVQAPQVHAAFMSALGAVCARILSTSAIAGEFSRI